MSTMTESRIVQMTFENDDFEKNVKQSLDTLSKLNSALEFKDGAHGLDEIAKASKRFDLSGIGDSVADASGRFSKLQIIGVTALANLSNAAVNTGKNLVKSIINPLTSGGWQRALNMEQAKFMLNGLLGEKAKEAIGTVGEIGTIMDNIYKSVEGTIYSLDKAALVAARLMASGINGIGENAEITKILQGIAGVSSVFSADYERVGDLFSTIKSTGVLMGQQVLSFTTMGVPLYAKLAEYLNKIVKEGREAGKSLSEMFPDNENLVNYLNKLGEGTKVTEADIKEMVSKSAISFDLFSDAMYDAFGTQASKSKEMYIGALEDMKAAAARIGEKFFKPILGDSTGEIPGVARDILNAMVPLFDSINSRLSAEGGVIERFSNAVQSAGKKIVMIIDLISAAFDFDETKTQLQALVDNGLADPSRLKNLETYAYQIARIKDVIEALGNIFSAVFGIIAAGYSVAKNALGFIFALAESILTVIAGARTPIAALKANVKVWGKDLGSFIAMMTDVVLNSQLLTSVLAIAKEAFANFDQIVKKTCDSLVSMADTITKIVHVLATGLANTIKEVSKSLKGVFDFTSIINTAILGSGLLKIGKILEFLKGEGMSFGAIFGDLQERFGQGILNNLRKSSVLLAESLDELRVTLVAYQKNLKAQILFKIAAAILMLAISLKILSSLNPQQLLQSVIAIAALGAVMMAVLKSTLSITKVMGKFNAKQLLGLQMVKGFFVTLALAMIGMATAVKIMGSLDPEQAINGILGLIAISVTMYMLFKYMSKINKVDGAASIARLLVIALSLDMLAIAFAGLGHMSTDQISNATLAMGIIAGTIVAMQFVMSKISKVQNVASVLPIIAMAIAFQMLGNTFRKLAMLEWSQIKQGTAAMAVTLGSVLATFAVVGKTNLNAFAAAIALGRIGSVISTVANVFIKLSELDKNQMKRAATALAAVEIAVVAMFALLGRMTGKEGSLGSNEVMKSLAIAALLTSMATMIKMMANSFIKLGGMEWGQIGKAAVGMAGILTIVGILALMSKKLAEVGGTKDLLMFSTTLILLGAGFKVFAAGIQAMGNMKPGVMAAGILGVAAAILVLNGVAKIVSKTFMEFLQMTVGMIAFGAGLAAIGAGAFVMGFGLASLASALKNITMEDVGRIVALVAAMAIISPIVQGVGVAFLVFGAGVALVGIALIAIGVGIAAIGLGFKVLAGSIGEAVAAINLFAGLDYTAVFKLAGLVTIFGVLSPLLIMFGAGLAAAGAGMAALGGGVLVVLKALKSIKAVIDHLFDGLAKTLVNSCKTAIDQLKGIVKEASAIGPALATVAKLIKTAITTISNLYSAAYKAGKHVVDGVVAGIRNNTSSAVNAANSLARQTLAAYKKAMGISSPAKKMVALAKFTVLGAVKGIKDNTHYAVDAMSDFAHAMMSAYDYVSENADMTPTITPVVDTTNVSKAVRSINSMMGASRSVQLSSEASGVRSPNASFVDALLYGLANSPNYGGSSANQNESLDPERIYEAVRQGASNAEIKGISLNGRELKRGLRDLGVVTR